MRSTSKWNSQCFSFLLTNLISISGSRKLIPKYTNSQSLEFTKIDKLAKLGMELMLFKTML